jgi:hypothetical protein
MWFLWLLLALNLAAALLFFLAPRGGEWLGRLCGKAGAHPGRFFVALASVSALAYVPLSALFKPWQWMEFGPFAFQPSFVPQYLIYFFAGLGIGVHGFERGLLACDGSLVRRWGFWLAGALAAFLVWLISMALIVQGHGVPGLQIIADLGFATAAAASCFGLAATFLRFAAMPRPILGSFSENAYGMYLVHYVFVLWLQYILLGVALFAVAKAAIVFAATLLLSWATIVAVCRVPIGARLFRAERRVSARVP